MPLFDPVNYATLLNVTNPSNEYTYLVGFLVFIENYLLNNYSLEFGTEVSTKQIQDAEDAQMLFPVNFVRDISKVEIKSYGESSHSEVLVLNKDYTTEKVKTAPKPIYQIRFLNRQICLPYFVKIKGKKGGKSTITGSPAVSFFFQNLLQKNTLVETSFENLIFDLQDGATLADTVKYLKTPDTNYFTQGSLPAINVGINQF